MSSIHRPVRWPFRSDRTVHRRINEHWDYVCIQEAATFSGCCGSCVCHHCWRYPTIRRHMHPRIAESRARAWGHPQFHQPVVNHVKRVQQLLCLKTAGYDRRPQRLHSAVFRSILGCTGHASGGYRTYWSDPWPGCHPLGCKCGQWGDQYHHKEFKGHTGRACYGGCRKWREVLRECPIWREPEWRCPFSELRQVLWPGQCCLFIRRRCWRWLGCLARGVSYGLPGIR